MKKNVRSFRDLVAWQRGMKLVRVVYWATRRMPREERYSLTAQMRRAAVSVPSNIAEGYARQSRRDYIKHLRIARGSLAELSTQLELTVSMKMIPPDQHLNELIREEEVILQSLIMSLERKTVHEQKSLNPSVPQSLSPFPCTRFPPRTPPSTT
jgi:four helix bundle protein